MKKLLSTFIAAGFVCMTLVGCSQQASTNSSSEAIEKSQAMQTAEEKAKFLVSEANKFISSEKFEDAVQTAQYILSNLDQNSQEAQSVIEKAQAKIKEIAQQKAGELKGEVNKALDSFGK